MQLYATKVTPMASEAARVLLAAGDVESNAVVLTREIEAELRAYLSIEREVNDKTKELLERTGRPQTEFGRVRVSIAESTGIKVGDETLDHLLDRVVAHIMEADDIDEVFASDLDLRRKLAVVFKKHMGVDSGMDAEIRAQLRHVKEGTSLWDIEYDKALAKVRARRGL